VRATRNGITRCLIAFVRGYQVAISPALASRCKYYPSCSQYAIDAFGRYGALRGFVLASWRLLRCNPFSNGGYDPVGRQRLFRGRSDAVPEADRSRQLRVGGGDRHLEEWTPNVAGGPRGGGPIR
jgi:uncharacterized protein